MLFDTLSNTGQTVVAQMVNTGLAQSIATIGRNASHTNHANTILSNVGVNPSKMGLLSAIVGGVVQQGSHSAGQLSAHIAAGNLHMGNLQNFNNYNFNKTLMRDTTGNTGSIAGHINNISNLVGASISGAVSNGARGGINYLTSSAYNTLSKTGILNNQYFGGALSGGVRQLASSVSGFVDALGFSPAANEDKSGSITSGASYAMDYDEFNGKFKFLYAVKFTFNNESKNINDSFTFLIKKFDRPKITVEHDQVNMYNFRTEVPKRTTYNPLSLEIHDDVKSNAMNFFVGYLRRISPIFNKSNTSVFETNGMNFGESTGSYGLHTDSGSQVALIEKIEVFHLYNHGTRHDLYTYHRPKITQFMLDALDMSDDGALNQISLEFAYDALNIEVGLEAEGVGTTFEDGIYSHMYGKSVSGSSDTGSQNNESLSNLLVSTAARPADVGMGNVVSSDIINKATNAVSKQVAQVNAIASQSIASVTNPLVNKDSFKQLVSKTLDIPKAIPVGKITAVNNVTQTGPFIANTDKVKYGNAILDDLLAPPRY